MKKFWGRWNRWFLAASALIFLWGVFDVLTEASRLTLAERDRKRKAHTCEVDSVTNPEIEKSWGMMDGETVVRHKIIPGRRCYLCADNSRWCEKVYEVQ